jgi:SWI/SNF-related matrix-associated actin-dependent regulator of chromatin subfamily A member 5
MIDDAQPEPYHIGEHIVAASSKLLAIDKILADVLPKGERVLIFSQWTECVFILYLCGGMGLIFGVVCSTCWKTT